MRQHAEHHQLAPAASVADIFILRHWVAICAYRTCWHVYHNTSHLVSWVCVHSARHSLGLAPLWSGSGLLRCTVRWFIYAASLLKLRLRVPVIRFTTTALLWAWRVFGLGTGMEENGPAQPSPAQWLNGFRGRPLAAFILHSRLLHAVQWKLNVIVYYHN
jgi:hypothetical protein